MELNTANFIIALKRADSPTLREAAIDYMSEWTSSEKSSYTEFALYQCIHYFFLDYLETADHPSRDMRMFFEHHARHTNWCEINHIENKETFVDDMLVVLNMAQVTEMMNGERVYCNGFEVLEDTRPVLTLLNGGNDGIQESEEVKE